MYWLHKEEIAAKVNQINLEIALRYFSYEADDGRGEE